jgi:hypothetical protein
MQLKCAGHGVTDGTYDPDDLNIRTAGEDQMETVCQHLVVVDD